MEYEGIQSLQLELKFVDYSLLHFFLNFSWFIFCFSELVRPSDGEKCSLKGTLYWYIDSH